MRTPTLEAHKERVGAPVPAELAAVRAAARRWQHGFVSRALSEPRRVVAHGVPPDARGKRLFDRVRSALGDLADDAPGEGTRVRGTHSTTRPPRSRCC